MKCLRCGNLEINEDEQTSVQMSSNWVVFNLTNEQWEESYNTCANCGKELVKIKSEAMKLELSEISVRSRIDYSVNINDDEGHLLHELGIITEYIDGTYTYEFKIFDRPYTCKESIKGRAEALNKFLEHFNEALEDFNSVINSEIEYKL